MPEFDASCVIYTLENEPDDQDVRRELETEDVQWVLGQQKLGNDWAWCQVTVTATAQHPNGYDTLEGKDYLCGCMYHSREDFINTSGYYEDMKSEALARLQAAWDEAVKAQEES